MKLARIFHLRIGIHSRLRLSVYTLPPSTSFHYCRISTVTMRPRVYVTRSDIPTEAINMLKERFDVKTWEKIGPIPREELLKEVQNKEGLFCTLNEKIDHGLLETAGKTLKVIGTMSVGVDHIDVPECKRRNILLGNTPDVLTDAVAELIVALVLTTCRRLFEAAAELTSGGWSEVSWGPLYMCGTSLVGKTVGIVGMGRIGQEVMLRMKPFKVSNFVYCGNSAKASADALGAKFVSFEELLKTSDIVIASCSLNEKTEKLFNKNAFKLMKSSAIFINGSRGGVVDQDALYEALTTGLIHAAGLDVMTPEPLPSDHPLTTLKNCYLLPHIGSATVETRVNMATLTAKNIIAGLEGKPLPAAVY